MWIKILLLQLFIFYTQALKNSEQPQLSWTQVNPRPSAAVISPVAYNDGVMVTFGHYDLRIQALLSTDTGLTWKEIPLDQTGFAQPPLPSYYMVIYAKTHGFVAVPTPLMGAGEGPGLGAVLVSADGINWKHVNTSENEIWFGINLATDGDVIVSAGGTPVYSTSDGIHWTKQTTYSLVAGVYYSKSLGNFLIYGYEPKDIILSSKTGTDFVQYLNMSVELGMSVRDISDIVESDDGIIVIVQDEDLNSLLAFRATGNNSWKVVYTTSGIFSNVDYMANTYCLSTYNNTGIGVYYYNGPTNSAVWDFKPSINGNSFAQAVPDAKVWIGTDSDSFSNGLIQRSTDSINWSTYNNGIVDPITEFFYSSVLNKFVLSTTTTNYLSPDGNTWTTSTVVGQLFYDPLSNSILGLNKENLFITQDLITINTLPLPSIPAQSQFTSIAFDSVGQRVYVACSWYKGFLQQGIVYSRTLSNTTWHSFTLDNEHVYTTGQILFGRGVAVVAGYGFDGIRLFSSSDGGISFQSVQFFDHSPYCKLSFTGPIGSQRFFVACDLPFSFTSLDGVDWQPINNGSNAVGFSYDAKFGYVAGLIDGTYSVSSDGLNFVTGGVVTLSRTPFDSFGCNGQDNCVMVSSFDNSIFVSNT